MTRNFHTIFHVARIEKRTVRGSLLTKTDLANDSYANARAESTHRDLNRLLDSRLANYQSCLPYALDAVIKISSNICRVITRWLKAKREQMIFDHDSHHVLIRSIFNFHRAALSCGTCPSTGYLICVEAARKNEKSRANVVKICTNQKVWESDT